MQSDPMPPIDDPRIIFAAERTLLAWVRTGLAMMGFGFVVARFGLFLLELHPEAKTLHSDFSGSVYIGAALVICGVVVNIFAAISHMKTLQGFKKGKLYQPPLFSLPIIVTLMVAIIGVLMTLRLVWLK